MGKIIYNPPDAENLYASVESMGHYSLDAAIADIIDNSITAQATKIEILCEWNKGNPYIRITDDGKGMNFQELLTATRLGSKNPNDKREKEDLGRFGLGLKTASFSQGKILTIISSKDGNNLNGIKIDKDDSKDWKQLQLTKNECLEQIESKTIRASFTQVQWNKLHRIYDDKNKIIDENLFNNLVIQAKRDLELIFHRYLEKEGFNEKIIIKINNDEMISNDPFLKEKSEKWALEEFRLFNRKISMQTYILPHYKDLDKNNFERLAGKEGYVRNQGFYVYRNRRLIFKGTWFKLAKHGDLSKLARIQLDIPNDIDEQFKITIDKSYAELPPGMRERMQGLINKIQGKSTKVFRHAGAKANDNKDINFWERKIKDKRILYSINRHHPIISGFDNILNKKFKSLFSIVIKHLEYSLPADSISIDIRDYPDKMVAGNTDREFIEETIKNYIEVKLQKQSNINKIIKDLEKTSFYKTNEKIIIEILKEQGHL